MPVYELEKFLNGNKLNGMKQKYPSKTKSLIAQTRNCAERYLQMLSRMAYMGTLQGEQLVLTQTDLATIDKAIDTQTSPGSLQTRLTVLERVGFLSVEDGTNTATRSFYSSKYPNMFPAVTALAKKTKGTFSGLNFYLFLKTDFRNILTNYKPTAEDYIIPLSIERRETAMALHKLALSLGCKVDISTFLKINYKYKGMEVLLMDTKDGVLDIRITEVYAWDDRTFFMDRLLSQSEERKRCADRHLYRCTACATSHVGQQIEFLGRHNRVCGGGMIGFVWKNPELKEFDDLEFFIKVRCEMINYLKSLPKAGK